MTEERLIPLLHRHFTRYPHMTAQDAYKLLHQATFGPGHAISNPAKVIDWLTTECRALKPAPEPLIESIHPTDQLVRLHLRPYLFYEGSLPDLAQAFIRSAEQTQGSAALIARRWAIFAAIATQFDRDDLARFGELSVQQWPAVHHSPVYVASYQPAYRVLIRPAAEMLCQALAIPFTPI